ncbi:hypothetical protein ILUMI_13921 [Ignelater luminosus]|uniref:Uncharacterized protein n=1 Tax=Ignelater luminosus TaxID=2038154 RepID=A0A8K0CV89_IGNLU|nr:hypothetical protein ILUMI_13921 [Ignelater luminosus]
MKVVEGLVEITQQPSALAHFFLTAPELQRPKIKPFQFYTKENPFKLEGPEFMNTVTKPVFSEQVTSDVSRIESLGRELHEAFKSDRLLDVSVNGTVHHCPLDHQPKSWIAIIDAMRELQALDKTIRVETCEDLADVFTKKIQRKYWQYDELHIVFDMHFDTSIKNLARDKRLYGAVATSPSLFGKEKLEYWKSFISASDEELIALQKFGTSDSVPDDKITIFQKDNSKPHFIKPNCALNAKVYSRKGIERRLKPFLEENYASSRYICWPDGASSHFAKTAVKKLEELNIKYIEKDENPPNVLELDPTERFWVHKAKRLYL